jgi:putative membrane protein
MHSPYQARSASRTIVRSCVPALRGGVTLVTTFVGLLITTWLSSGLKVDGATTWVLTTLIVWLAALLADVILPVFLVKKAINTSKA